MKIIAKNKYLEKKKQLENNTIYKQITMEKSMKYFQNVLLC